MSGMIAMIALAAIAWIGTLAALLCTSAMATAVAMRRRKRKPLVYLVLAAPPLVLLGLATLAAAAGPRLLSADPFLRDALLVLLATSILGSVAILVVGSRRAKESDPARAAGWSSRPLFLGAFAGLGATVVAVALMDAGSRAEIERRREANASRRAALVDRWTADELADAEYGMAFALFDTPPVRALLQLRDEPGAPSPGDQSRGVTVPNEAEVAAFAPLLDACPDLLAALTRAAARPAARLGFDPLTAGYDMLLPDLARMRTAARIAATAARVAAARGDGAEALERVVSIDRFAEHVAQSPTIIHLLVACAIRAQATETIAAIAGLVPLDEAAILDGSFDDALSDRMRRTAALERSMCESVVIAFASDPAAIDVEVMTELPNLPTAVQPFYRLLLMPTEFVSIDGTFDALDEAARAGTRIPASTARPAGLLAAILLPAMEKFVDALIASRATVPLRRASILVRTAASDDEILANLPIDPLDPAGGRLRAHREPDAWVVYSVGPNGRDDDGPGWGGDDVGIRLRVEG